MRSSTSCGIALNITMLALASITSMPTTCQAFLAPTLTMAPTRCHTTNTHRAQHTTSRRAFTSRVSSGTVVSMSADEEGAATTEAVGAVPGMGVEEADKIEPVMPSAPKPKVAAGPMMQPAEDKKRQKEEAEMAEPPKANPWASNVFKRGVALQAVVLAFIVYLQLQPQEVQNLGICPPFVDKGCVSFGEWVLIVFTGAPIPPLY